jgi:hypothetical protein
MWYFHVYMYYNPNWFISPIFLHSTLVLFLWCLADLRFLYSPCIESTSIIFNFLVIFFYANLLDSASPCLSFTI